ncbi:hypothetical protein FIBSPDRAFT_799339, partial [Athelia psychrophila]
MADIHPSSSTTLSNNLTEAKHAAKPPPPCAICRHASIYTCPRCAMRTCSLICSTEHKTRVACSGVRDRAKFVPMNAYGWGTMMDDFVFLEDVGRKVGEWGGEIGRGGFAVRGAERGRGRGRGRGNGRGGRGGGGGGAPKTKQDVLRQQLSLRDIDMELLPIGMERKKLNKSLWDYKKQAALFTIEFRFHAPADPSAPSSQPRRPTYSFLTHKNHYDTPLLALLQSKIRASKPQNDSLPAWVPLLVLPDADEPTSFTPPLCLISVHTDPRTGLRPQSTFYKMDPSHKLSVLLRNMTFVEFPTIDVWEEGDAKFGGTIVDAAGGVKRYADGSADGDRKAKRQKLDVRAGKKAIQGLLGDYGSDGDEDKMEEENVMAALGAYASGEDEPEVDVAGADGTDDDDDTPDAELTAEQLLQLVQQANALDAQRAGGGEDQVDWGDSENEE